MQSQSVLGFLKYPFSSLRISTVNLNRDYANTYHAKMPTQVSHGVSQNKAEPGKTRVSI